jgi:hypothetical protein
VVATMNEKINIIAVIKILIVNDNFCAALRFAKPFGTWQQKCLSMLRKP